MKKRCSVCNQEWPDTMKHCPCDGARLVDLPTGSLLGRTLDDKYHILTVIGEGSTGTVYKAQRAVIGDEVAVKTLRPELIPNPSSIERFRREAQAAGRIRHPNAISIYDFGLIGNIAYIVMELLNGRTLRDVLGAEQYLNLKRTVHIFMQICGAVQRAHRNRVIHRDLKPENIILEEFEGLGETVKVIDFSLAKLKISGNLMRSLTEEGKVAGTPYYMSPEQWLDKPLDPRSDVYSLGIMLYETLSGEMPFDANTVMELAKKHVQIEPKSPQIIRKEIPKEVSDVIMKALAKKPEQRHQSALELARELRAAAGLETDEDALVRNLKRLNPATSMLNGALIIRTSPPNCNIYINNHFAGTTDQYGSLLLQDVPMGEYYASVVRVGYKEWESKLKIDSGAATLEATLEPVEDESLSATKD
ncbi:MAG: serine/threonine-protein kinase [Acidobacteriota bacterium]